MQVLTVNAGSSSLKLSMVDDEDRRTAALELETADPDQDDHSLRDAIAERFGGAELVAHRIVHGGERFRSAVIVEGEAIGEMRALEPLAPLHQRRGLDALEAVRECLPGVPTVACFDTAYHATLPAAATTYALPRAWRARWGLRRYGFHGLSHAWIARRAGGLAGGIDGEPRIVSAHLGSGASLCAIADGRSLDTTMGFTPLEGLVMATRSGSVDPGLLVWLLQRGGITVDELAHGLEHESGMRGLTGSADIRDALGAADRDAAAALALEVYSHRLGGCIAQMAASLGGLDVLAFTGGIGEHSAEVRAAAARKLSFLGIAVDPERNSRSAGERDISAPGASVRTVVIPAREDAEMARQARALFA